MANSTRVSLERTRARVCPVLPQLQLSLLLLLLLLFSPSQYVKGVSLSHQQRLSDQQRGLQRLQAQAQINSMSAANASLPESASAMFAIGREIGAGLSA